MAEPNKASIFQGYKNVSGSVPPSSTMTNNQNQSNSETMASTATNNNSVPSTQPAQFSFTAPSLTSLANATEPNAFSSNQQQPSVATFPQRTSGASSTANNGSPFGLSFSQTSTPGPTQSPQSTNTPSTQSSTPPFSNQSTANTAPFSFANLSTTTPLNFSFVQPTGNQSPANVPRFSFANLPTTGPSNFSFAQPTGNPSQVRQQLGSFTGASPTQKQEVSNNTTQSSSFTNNFQSTSAPTNNVPKFTVNNSAMLSQRFSDPPTPTSEQSGANNDEQEEADTPANTAERPATFKKLTTTLQDSNALVVDRSDPNCPLYSLTQFEELNLNPELLKGVYNMGFQCPSKIQSIALPKLLDNPPKNIIAQSQSGTGKTAAFSLAILSRIDPSIQSPQALILAPTFELAIQTGSVIEKMAKFLPYIQLAYAVRDPNKSRRSDVVRGQILTQPIVIGTPGTVEDWCFKMRVIDLSKLRICCVDEADVMIATGNFQQTCVRLVNGLNPNCQMMLFSATYADDVMAFAREIVREPAVLRLKREKQALTNIKQFYVSCYDDEHKYQIIEQIYACMTLGQAMIFCRTKAAARALAVRLAAQGHSVRELTAALEIEVRAAVIQQFREGIFRVLISTNVASRGLDIADVSLVINYDMPVTMSLEPDFETYLHRIGRCGRFGKQGYTFNLIGSERDFNVMKAIEEYFTHPIEQITMEDIYQLEKDQE